MQARDLPSNFWAVLVLLEESDPLRRCAAHLELGQRAIARHDLATAVDHLQEAADLDPTDERPKSILRDIARKEEKPGRFAWVGRWFKRAPA